MNVKIDPTESYGFVILLHEDELKEEVCSPVCECSCQYVAEVIKNGDSPVRSLQLATLVLPMQGAGCHSRRRSVGYM